MSIDIKNKKTNLEDKASIYSKRDDDISDWERVRSMTRKQRMSFFTTYYLPKLLIILVIAVVLFYIVWVDFIHKSNIYMRCAVLNESVTDSALTELSDQFTASMKMDVEKNKASFYLYYTRPEIASQIGANLNSDLSEISSRLIANMLDAMIASPEDVEQTYLKKGFIADLDTFLTKDEYARIKKYLYIPNTAEHKNNKAYGLHIKKSAVYQKLFSDRTPLQKDPVFFVVSNATEEGKDYARKFIYYLFPEIKGE